MGNIYTISELASLLSVTRPIVVKKLSRLWGSVDVPYTIKSVNNRDIKAIELTGEQEAKLGILHTNDISNDTGCDTTSDTHTGKVDSTSVTAFRLDELILKVLDTTEGYATRIESYTERIINSESQVKLLTMIENTKDNEINRLNALLKQYDINIDTLQKEKDKYFNDVILLTDENKLLKEQLRAQDEEIKALKDENDILKTKKWWHKKVF